MPDIKITELPVASELSDSDELIVQQSDGTKRATLSDLPAGVPDGGTTGQYLVKSSATEGDANWQTKEVELTQAQYDALPSSKLTDGVSYYITDGESAPSTNRFSADGISYGSGSVADALDSLSDSSIKSITYTGTTSSTGYLQGSLSSFGIPSNAVILSAYMKKGSFSNYRYIEMGCYGGAGYYFLCKDNGTAIASASVTLKIYYAVV